MKHRLTKFLIGLAFIAGFFALHASAQVVPTNLWRPNYASNTIAPINSSLQIPCANIVNGCGGGAASTSINGVAGPNYTFSVVSTSSTSSFTTSTAQVFLNLLQYTSSSDITISPTGTIVFASHNISQFTNNSGYLTSSTGVTSFNGSAGAVTYAPSTTIPTNNNQLTNGSGFITSSPSSLSVSGNVTSTSFTANSTSTFSVLTDFDTTLYASTNEQGLDHGTYVDTLCQAALTNASSALVIFPQEIIQSSSWQVEIQDSYNGGDCTYTGQGTQGTIWYWGGTGTSTAVAENVPDTNSHYGFGYNDMSILGNYASTTVGMLIGGTGGEGALNQNLVLKYFYDDQSIATNTFLMTEEGGYIGAASSAAVLYNSVANAGEGLHYDHVTLAETVQPSSTVQQCVSIAGGFAQIEWTNDHFDNCGETVFYPQTGAGTEIYSASYWENTQGDNIGAYIPIVNNAPSVTIDTYGGQFTNDASNSTPLGFISNAGTYNNYGMTAYKNATGTMSRWVTDQATGNDFDYGFSNPNGEVTQYKSATANIGTVVVEGTVANSYPYEVSMTATTTYTYGQGSGNVIATLNNGHYNWGGSAIATTTNYFYGSQGYLSNVTNFSTTITLANGKYLFFTGPNNASATLPAWSVSQGADFVINDDSTSSAYQLQVATTTSDSIFDCLTGATTTFILLPKEAVSSSIEVVNDGITTGIWRTICSAH